MSPADLSIKRPIFITCIVILMLVMGYLSFKKLPVDLFPNVTFPIVMVNTVYPGAGPEEVETLVSKVLEDEVSTLPGIKTLRSINKDSVSTVVAEFTLETDIKYAEQQIRDRVGTAKAKLPKDIKEPVIRRIDPADSPVMIIAITADLPEGQLFDLADQELKPKIEQVNQVGLVDVIGGRKREIQVLVDRDKLKARELSASMISSRIAAAGQNIPAGKVDEAKTETSFRTLGEFKSVKDVGNTIANFLGNDVPVKVSDIADVKDTLEDEKTRAFMNGQKALLLNVYRQSGSNTIEVVNAVKKKIAKINADASNLPGKPHLEVVRDGSKAIKDNVADVEESIIIGIILTVIVVYFFLGSGRSTIITGLALPNSLLGSFMLMQFAGFTINIMSLLALSLAVGLLIDDAIVVRENIFRHVEMGKKPINAALDGAKEVTLAVIATTLAVIAVFGPIAFLSGIVGQFFREFGMTVCFAMLISLFDALTIAPMMSAYFAGSSHGVKDSKGIWGATMGRLVGGFDKLQTWLEDAYAATLRITLKMPILAIAGALVVFFLSFVAVKHVPKTFLPANDAGEFMATLEMPQGTNIGAMHELATKVDGIIRSNPEVATVVMTVGKEGEANTAQFFLTLVPSKQRKVNTSQMKDKVREQLKPFAYALPIVKDIDMVGGGQRAFTLNISGTDMDQLEKYARQVFDKLKAHPGLKDVEYSNKPGKPEIQFRIDDRKAQRLGVSTLIIGSELRTLIEGSTPAVLREKGREYDIRVRLKEDQRNLKAGFDKTYVPNINNAVIRLRDVAEPVSTIGPATINRQDRSRYIAIMGDVAPNGPGIGGVMTDVRQMFAKDLPLPPGIGYRFVGQAESFEELGQSMVLAMLLGVTFIFLVLASLYESFITPFTIMLVLPLAMCGAFYALWITQASLDLFSMIGVIMLLGIATKNSILLVDYTKQLTDEGVEMKEAIIRAGKTRLRPILMTTIALIAGMLPIAIGLNEASKQRTSMGIGIIGGLISSTALTLIVVPAAYSYIERFRVWSGRVLRRIASPDHGAAEETEEGKKHKKVPAL